MAAGLSISDLGPSSATDPAPPSRKSTSRGLSVSSLATSGSSPSPSPAKPGGQSYRLLDHPQDVKKDKIELPTFSGISADSVAKGIRAIYNYTDQSLQHPMSNPLALVRGTAQYAEWAAQKAVEGIVGIVKHNGWDYNTDAAVQAGLKVHQAFQTLDQEDFAGTFLGEDKEADKAPINKVLSVIGRAPEIAGDTVFDALGNAVVAAGTQALVTFLMIKPGTGALALDKVASEPKPGEPVHPVKSAFGELAAKNPEAAEAIQIHVGQVSPKLDRAMKDQIAKAKRASDKDLREIGRKSAEADVLTIKGKDVGPDVSPQVAEAQKHAEMLKRLYNPEKVSANVATAAREGMDALADLDQMQDMTKSPQERALERERVAALRDKEEGVRREPEPEPIPKKAAEREGEHARRDMEDESAADAARAAREGYSDNDITYFNMGVPVTRSQIEGAFRALRGGLRQIPGVAIAEGKMGKYFESYIKTFNPEAMGPAARLAGQSIAENFFRQAEGEHRVWQQGKARRTYWMKMGDDAGMQFIKGFETGQKFSNPIWEAAKKDYRAWADDIYRQDMRTGFTYDPVDHYMPHLFKDQEGVTRFMQKKFGNRWADPRFIKERGYDLYQQAIDAGFTPKYRNPEEIMQARQMASDIAALRNDLLVDLEAKGVAVKAAKGAERPPEGFSPNSRRSPTGQRYWVREEADALMHNAFDSKGLWERQGVTGEAFRGYMELKNKIVPLKLAGSLFHPMHVVHIDASAEMTRAGKMMLGKPSLGTVKDFILKMATSFPYSPGSIYRSLWDNPKTGYPILRVFQGKRPFEKLSEADKAAYRDMAEGGMIPTRPKEEMSNDIQKLNDAIVRRSATALFHLPFAVVSGITHVMYNTWIPTLKIASYLKDVKTWRELNGAASDAQRQVAFRNIARKVEARYGEMNYQTLFMNKAIKDVGVATNLSLGWNLGLLDQYVGGAIDLGKAAVKPGGIRAKVAEGLLDRPIFAAYYVGSALMLGGLMHKMFTGKNPQSLIDYTNPESGELDKYGKPIRLNTMWYTREFESLYKHMQQQGTAEGVSDFILNKGAGVFTMVKEGATGVNSLGDQIRDENSPGYKQLEQTLAYELSDIEPISLEAIGKSTGSKAKDIALSTLGFTPAGQYIDRSAMEGQIATAYHKFVKPQQRSYGTAEMSKDMTKLRDAFKSDDPKYDDLLEGAIAKYDLDQKDTRRIEKLFNSPKEEDFDPTVFQFSKLPWDIQKPMLDKMTPEERERFLPHISKSKRQKYERESEQ